MKFCADDIALATRLAIVKTAREYGQRAKYLEYDNMVSPEYLLTVRIYDALWRKFKSKGTNQRENESFNISLEEPTTFVKCSSSKRGKTASPVAKNKRHDLCVWIKNRPICVIEVKRFGNRYGVFEKDLQRLESVVKGRLAPTYSILAFYGWGFYDKSKSQKHIRNIYSKYSNRGVVDVQEIRFRGLPERNLAGTITVS